jgi:hypothetical protein
MEQPSTPVAIVDQTVQHLERSANPTEERSYAADGGRGCTDFAIHLEQRSFIGLARANNERARSSATVGDIDYSPILRIR